MRLLQTTLFLAVSAGCALAAADPKLLALTPPDARILAGVQVSQAKGSPFGQFVLTRVLPAAEMDKLKAETGFDPRTDLTEIAVGAVTEGKGVVAGRGAFQPARIVSLATTHGVAQENYRGFTVLAPGANEAISFLDATTVVIGSPDMVKASIDRWVSGASASGSLAAKAAEVSSTSHAWGVANNLSQLTPAPPAGTQLPPEAQMVQNVVSKISMLSGGVNFGESIVMRGQAVATSASDAQALADVFQFLMGMASTKAPLPFAPTATANGSNVDFHLTLTQQDVEKLFAPHTTAQMQAARVSRK